MGVSATFGSYEHTESKLDRSDLATKFERFYKSRQRIIVRNPWGEVQRGYVGRTSGWKPSYMLLARANSRGSSDLLDDRWEIIGTVDRYR
jgi:hypothetical protein